jgi:hypothetical protein
MMMTTTTTTMMIVVIIIIIISTALDGLWLLIAIGKLVELKLKIFTSTPTTSLPFRSCCECGCIPSDFIF